jgi:predicted nucleic acid-binding protein
VIIVDSTVWIDHFHSTVNPHTAWLDLHAYSDEIGITDLILCEVLQGARDDFRFTQMRRALLRLPVIAGSSRELAVAAAQNYRNLRGRGITIRKIVDTLIATACIEQGHRLLHHDRDFDPFEEHLGLQVIHPERQ